MLDWLILLVLVGFAGFQVVIRLSRSDPAEPSGDDDLLLVGFEEDSSRVPGRSVLGENHHNRLTETLSAREDQISDLELAGFGPDREPAPTHEPESIPTPSPEDPSPDVPPAAVDVSDEEPSVIADVLDRPDPDLAIVGPDEDVPGLPPADGGTLPPVDEIGPEPASTEGIWVQSSRTGGNPIRVEDHVSVNADQLAQMAGYRNISTDIRFSAPQFNISAVGTGRLGTYVIVDSQMIRLNGQVKSPASPPRAWRLHEVSGNEIYWVPID